MLYRCVFDEQPVGANLYFAGGEVEVGFVTLVAGPHAIGKSVVAFSLAKMLVEGFHHHRYALLKARCTPNPEGGATALVVPAERVLLPYADMCREAGILDALMDEVAGSDEFNNAMSYLEERGIRVKKIWDSTGRILDYLRLLCEWINTIAWHYSEPISPFAQAVQRVIEEAIREAAKNIAGGHLDEEVVTKWSVKEWEDYISKYLMPYHLDFVVKPDSSGKQPTIYVRLVDRRTYKVQELMQASMAVAPATVFTAIPKAARIAFEQPVVLVVEEPEEEAHPFTQYTIGYLLAYVPLKLRRLDRPKPHSLRVIVTTHSPYILAGVYSAAYQIYRKHGLEAGEVPRTYYLDYLEDREKPVVKLEKWNLEKTIPGFFHTEMPITPSPYIIEELEKLL